MRTVLLLVWKEYLHVFRDRATMFQVLAIPAIQLLILGNAATFAIRQTPVYLVDRDGSTMSRELAARFAASENFRIEASSAAVQPAGDALLAGRVTMVLHIPPEFEADIVRHGAGRVQLVLDAQQGAAAGVVRAYASRVIARYAAELNARLTAERLPAAALARRPPRVEVRTRGWYNAELDYHNYMVPGILVALVTIIGTLLTAQNIAREKELGTLEQLNVTPVTRGQFIAGKLLPFWILAMVELCVGLALAWLVFDVPVRGSLLLVFAVAAVYLLAALGLGLLISTVAETQQQAMFVTFFVMMIYLLMSGLFTPLTSMPEWVQWLAELNPVKHFVQVMRSVLVRGAGPAEVMVPVLALATFAVVILALAVRQSSKRVG